MTERYAVFGNPVAHSLSPEIHRQFAESCAQAMDYQKTLVEIQGFNDAATAFFKQGGKGLNITVPFKEDAFHFADLLTTRAEAAEAVNTLSMQSDGKVLGDNTDGAGLVWDLTERLQWDLANARMLILGAGGAVKGVLMPLLASGLQSILIANRTKEKAQSLATQHRMQVSACGLDEFEHQQTFDIIINATSASLSQQNLDIPSNLYHKDTAFYDMVYAKEPTPFLKQAIALGAVQTADGLGMLVGQAAESFKLWRGVSPDVSSVYRRLR